MVTPTSHIEHHPDLAAMRMRYEEAAETPAVQVIDGLALMSGLLLAASPWIFGFNDMTTLAVTNFITGGVMAVMALGMASVNGRIHGVAWTAPILGLWAIASPWLVSGNVDTTTTIMNNVVIGALYLVFSGCALAIGMKRARK